MTVERGELRFGHVIHVQAGDPKFDIEIQRATDALGSDAVTILITVASEVYHEDLLPRTTTHYWYRARHILDNYTDGNWTAWVSAGPGRVLSEESGGDQNIDQGETRTRQETYYKADGALQDVTWERGGIDEPSINLFKRGSDSTDDVVPSSTREFIAPSYIDAERRVDRLRRLGIDEVPDELFKRNFNTLDDIFPGGSIAVSGIAIDFDAERILLGGATAPLTGVGIFMGKDGTDYEFRVGDPAGSYIHWNGSTLVVKGDITGSTGTFSGTVSSSSFTAPTASFADTILVKSIQSHSGNNISFKTAGGLIVSFISDQDEFVVLIPFQMQDGAIAPVGVDKYVDFGAGPVDGSFWVEGSDWHFIDSTGVERVASSGTAPNAYAIIADSAGTVQFSASGEDTLRFAAAGNLSVAFDAATEKVTFNGSALMPKSGGTFTGEVDFGGGIQVTGGAGTGAGTIVFDASGGLRLRAASSGSSWIFMVEHPNGDNIIAVPPGTSDVTFFGNATALSFFKSSSRRWKENIQPWALDRAALLALEPVEYDLTQEKGGGHGYGFIAEDVAAMFASPDRDAIEFDRITTQLVAGWQDHERRIAALEAKVGS